MPVDEVIVSNTSPLLNLALIDRLDCVERQFSSVEVPEQVWAELMAGEDAVPELERYHDRGVIESVSVAETDLFREFLRELDLGEAAALAYAIEVDADLCLLDEREARAGATRHDLDRTGVIGILLRGARNGEGDLRDELDSLRADGFWIGEDLYQRVLESGSAFDS